LLNLDPIGRSQLHLRRRRTALLLLLLLRCCLQQPHRLECVRTRRRYETRVDWHTLIVLVLSDAGNERRLLLHGGELCGGERTDRLHRRLIELRADKVLERQIIPSIDEELIFQMLWRVQILALRIVSRTPSLYRIVTGRNTTVLHVDMRRWMSEFAFVFGAGALTALKLSTDFELEPSRILNIHEMIDHGHGAGCCGGGGC
jgi:hypothetical protein